MAINENLLNQFLNDIYMNKELKPKVVFSEGLKIFLNHCKLEKRQGTLKFYIEALKHPINFFQSIGIETFNDIDNKAIEKYIAFESTNKTNTINKRITAIKTLINYLIKRGLMDKMNFTFDKLKESKPKIEIIDNDIIKEVLNYLKNKSDETRVIILLSMQTGIRRTELAEIKVKNIDFKNKSIFLEHTKTNNPRYIYFDENIEVNLKNLVSKKSNYIFESKLFKTVEQRATHISNIFKQIKDKLDLNKFSSHTLRHTYATYLLKNGVDIHTVSKLLGHSNLQMTQRYLHINNIELSKNSRAFNPLARMKDFI